ncbi:hypothetical protein BT69DRAFT_1335337 [Atractiella rhizophila]|nr:hypothetical protein BT69DRAFT_1335337 [Atractiella rhizophila]
METEAHTFVLSSNALPIIPSGPKVLSSTPTQSPFRLLSLPPELQLHVISFLSSRSHSTNRASDRTLFSLSLVNKHFRILVRPFLFERASFRLYAWKEACPAPAAWDRMSRAREKYVNGLLWLGRSEGKREDIEAEEEGGEGEGAGLIRFVKEVGIRWTPVRAENTAGWRSRGGVRPFDDDIAFLKDALESIFKHANVQTVHLTVDDLSLRGFSSRLSSSLLPILLSIIPQNVDLRLTLTSPASSFSSAGVTTDEIESFLEFLVELGSCRTTSVAWTDLHKMEGKAWDTIRSLSATLHDLSIRLTETASFSLPPSEAPILGNRNCNGTQGIRKLAIEGSLPAPLVWFPASGGMSILTFSTLTRLLEEAELDLLVLKRVRIRGFEDGISGNASVNTVVLDEVECTEDEDEDGWIRQLGATSVFVRKAGGVVTKLGSARKGSQAF